MSPTLNPAFSAGLSFNTSLTNIPTFRLYAFAIASVTLYPAIPILGLDIFLFSISSFIIGRASSLGIANPIPSTPVATIFTVFIPITSPLLFASAPPLFPVLIAASVCIN